MKYDSHNRLTEYIVTDDRKIRLLYDPMGRVFRKEIYDWVSEDWEFEKATHYYYQGGNLVQEYDVTVLNPTTAEADIEWDYLRGLGGQVVRKRETDGETDTDTLHVNSAIGTTLNVLFPDMDTPTLKEGGYKTTAEGEPFHVTGFEPQEENHIQYHGGFLEDKEFHTSVAGQERGYFYRMGVRHYVPAFGRFMQRDPITYMRAPHKTNPLSANPYQYAYNRPTQMSDTSGYQPEGPETLPAEWSGFGGGSGTDGGCGGGHSPFRNTPGSGSGDPGDDGDDSEEAKRKCVVWWPEKCVDDPRYPDCNVHCCQYDDQPSWLDTCCDGGVYVDLNSFCNLTWEDECDCPCCWAGGEQNAPAAMGGGASGGGGGSIAFGPPKIGPNGKGGEAMSALPINTSKESSIFTTILKASFSPDCEHGGCKPPPSVPYKKIRDWCDFQFCCCAYQSALKGCEYAGPIIKLPTFRYPEGWVMVPTPIYNKLSSYICRRNAFRAFYQCLYLYDVLDPDWASGQGGFAFGNEFNPAMGDDTCDGKMLQ